jgi:hypothetical protein
LGLVLAVKHQRQLDTSITNNNQQLTTIIFHMINQQVPPENRYRKNKNLCQNFAGTSSELQNWLETHKTGRQYLKTEEKH